MKTSIVNEAHETKFLAKKLLSTEKEGNLFFTRMDGTFIITIIWITGS